MTEHWLEEAVAACKLPPPSAFPRNLADEIPLWLPVTLVSLPHLTSDAVRDWLARRGIRHPVSSTQRRLHGCMMARAGCAVLFHDSEDTDREQRFTLAHEVAHFVLDHLLPRARALRAFGEAIRPVLDGRRRRRIEEALSSVLDRIPIGVQVKLMDRSPSGFIQAGVVAESERRADRLALELLAPAEFARPVLKDTPGAEGEALLAFCFGLPEELARTYARMLLRRERTQRFSILEFLGEAGR
jgi:IrrE N-terminal-like domain